MNANSILFINFCWLLGMLLATSRLVYLRSKRELLRTKYKDTSRIKEVEQLIGNSRLVIAMTLTLFVALMTFFSIYRVSRDYGDNLFRHLVFTLSPGLIICLITVVLGYRYLDSRGIIIKP